MTVGGGRLYARPLADPTRALSVEGSLERQRPAIFIVAVEIYRPEATLIHSGVREYSLSRQRSGLFRVAPETAMARPLQSGA
jgi:hypothetical protein